MVVYILRDCSLVESDAKLSMTLFYEALYVAEDGKVIKNRIGPSHVDDTPELRQAVIDCYEKDIDSYKKSVG